MESIGFEEVKLTLKLKGWLNLTEQLESCGRKIVTIVQND